METILRVKDLRKEYGEKVALKGVSFEVRRGEIVGLLGVNGAGKTTLMQILLGILSATSGTVTLFGKSLADHRVESLRRMNFCSTYAALPANLKVRQNLRFFAGVYSVRDRDARISELLDRFGIGHLANAVTGFLSSGEATRLNICKALLNRPELLLLDEPTASLDPDIADRVRTVLRNATEKEGIAMLYTSHNMQDIETICDRLIFIHEGEILAEGTPAEIVRGFGMESLEEVFIHLARNEGKVGGE